MNTPGAPLSGRRILITRAQRQSGGLHDRLQQLGAEVLLLPTIETIPPVSYAALDEALRDAQSFDWLVVTSSNAVRVIGERLGSLGMQATALSHLRCAAVGPATAEALRSLHLAADLVPGKYVGEELAAALAPQARGQRVLLVRAAAARDVVPAALQAAGATLTVVEAYRTVLPEGAVEQAAVLLRGESPPDAVLFTSGSTVAHFAEVLQRAGVGLPASVACVSIGPITSAALSEAGFAVAAEAPEATLDALVRACVQLLDG